MFNWPRNFLKLCGVTRDVFTLEKQDNDSREAFGPIQAWMLTIHGKNSPVSIHPRKKRRAYGGARL